MYKQYDFVHDPWCVSSVVDRCYADGSYNNFYSIHYGRGECHCNGAKWMGAGDKPELLIGRPVKK